MAKPESANLLPAVSDEPAMPARTPILKIASEEQEEQEFGHSPTFAVRRSNSMETSKQPCELWSSAMSSLEQVVAEPRQESQVNFPGPLGCILSDSDGPPSLQASIIDIETTDAAAPGALHKNDEPQATSQARSYRLTRTNAFRRKNQTRVQSLGLSSRSLNTPGSSGLPAKSEAGRLRLGLQLESTKVTMSLDEGLLAFTTHQCGDEAFQPLFSYRPPSNEQTCSKSSMASCSSVASAEQLVMGPTLLSKKGKDNEMIGNLPNGEEATKDRKRSVDEDTLSALEKVCCASGSTNREPSDNEFMCHDDQSSLQTESRARRTMHRIFTKVVQGIHFVRTISRPISRFREEDPTCEVSKEERGTYKTLRSAQQEALKDYEWLLELLCISPEDLVRRQRGSPSSQGSDDEDYFGRESIVTEVSYC